MLLLALLWWTWSAYAWLGNQARVDEGVLRVGMAAAMAAIFIVALTIPEAWDDAPGGLDGPLVLVGAYLVVRCVHFMLYTVAATGDRGLRHQLAISSGPLLLSAALLVPGALLGGRAQTLLFAGALLVDWAGVYLTARQGSWRLRSAGVLDRATRPVHHPGPRRVGGRHRGGGRPQAHQRAAAAGGRPGRGRRRRPVVAVLRRGVAGGRAPTAGGGWPVQGQPGPGGLHLRALPDRRRHRPHRPRRRGVLAHADAAEPLGGFYGAALFGGPALYLTGYLLFKQRMHNARSLPRLVTVGVLLAALPAAIVLPPLAGLAGLALILAALVGFETTRYAETRRSLRNP
jgi:hypothetical protein